jgi:hypothetical protein
MAVPTSGVASRATASCDRISLIHKIRNEYIQKRRSSHAPGDTDFIHAFCNETETKRAMNTMNVVLPF